VPIRRNLDDAKDYSRLVSRQNELITQNQVAPEDRILFIDRSEFYELAQPKQTSLSGLAQSVVDTPEFTNAVQKVEKAYGAWVDTTVQTNPVADTRRFMQFNTPTLIDSVTVVSGTRIIMPVSGVYDIQFSAQLRSTTTKTNFDIWLIKNNVDVEWSNTRVAVEGSTNAPQVAAWNFLVDAVPGDNFQLGWSSDATSAQIWAVSGITTPTRPNIPSVILTVEQV
jgi:hypothetical protein